MKSLRTMTNDPAPSGLAIAFSPSLVKRSLITMLLVGTILNIINQWPGFTGKLPLNWLSLLLTYFVPYAVSTISGTFTLLEQQKKAL